MKETSDSEFTLSAELEEEMPLEDASMEQDLLLAVLLGKEWERGRCHRGGYLHSNSLAATHSMQTNRTAFFFLP